MQKRRAVFVHGSSVTATENSSCICTPRLPRGYFVSCNCIGTRRISCFVVGPFSSALFRGGLKALRRGSLSLSPFSSRACARRARVSWPSRRAVTVVAILHGTTTLSFPMDTILRP